MKTKKINCNKCLLLPSQDVAVASTGTVYISDGYCNSRIVVFTPNGHYLTEFANNGQWPLIQFKS